MEEEPPSLAKVFEDAFPYYLSLGMTYEQYWERDPYLVRAYYQAHMLQIEQDNQKLFVLSTYIGENFAVTLGNMFAKKGSKKLEYRKEPFRITPLSPQEKEEKARKEREKIVASFTAWGDRWKKFYEKGSVNEQSGSND